MFTFKEIDQRIENYEEELHWGFNTLKNFDNSELNDIFISLGYEKIKIEFYCFVTSSYIDLLCTYRNLKRSKTEWEKSYNIKFAYLIAYETINTYYKYKGEVFKLIKKEEKEKYEDFFKMLNRELADFKQDYDYEKIMPNIRNKFSAHYDKSFIEYYSNFELIDNKKSKDIIRDFLYFINPLHYFTYSWVKGEIDDFLFINSWMT